MGIRILGLATLGVACLLVSAGPLYGQRTRKTRQALSPAEAIVDPDSQVQEPVKTINDWKPLLPENSLDGWEITNFGGEADAEVAEGVLKLGMGQPLTGITYKGTDFPTENFEMRWKAQRIEGSDFFAGVTFPIGDQFASFIAGGWGGGLVGLSSINGNDASENQTATFQTFKNKEWYDFRVKVTSTKVTAWVNDKQAFEVDRDKNKFSLRAEVLKSKPLGYCVFQSVVEIKQWEYRRAE
jgi:hypothetical protein